MIASSGSSQKTKLAREGAQVILQYYSSYRFPLHLKIWCYCPEWPRRAAGISRVKSMEKPLLNQQKLRAHDRSCTTPGGEDPMPYSLIQHTPT